MKKIILVNIIFFSYCSIIFSQDHSCYYSSGKKSMESVFNTDYSLFNQEELILTDKNAIPFLSKKLQSEKVWEIKKAIIYFARIQDSSTTSLIIPFLNHTDKNVSREAIVALGSIGSEVSVPYLCDLLHSNNKNKVEILYAFKDITHADALECIQEYRIDENTPQVTQICNSITQTIEAYNKDVISQDVVLKEAIQGNDWSWGIKKIRQQKSRSWTAFLNEQYQFSLQLNKRAKARALLELKHEIGAVLTEKK